jgi:hypothetical protein
MIGRQQQKMEGLVMLFIKLTGKDTSNDIYINATAINGVVQKQGHSRVYTNSDLVPYEVRETTKEIMQLINSSLLKQCRLVVE